MGALRISGMRHPGPGAICRASLQCSIEFQGFGCNARKKGSLIASPTSPRREASLLDLARNLPFRAIFFSCVSGDWGQPGGLLQSSRPRRIRPLARSREQARRSALLLRCRCAPAPAAASSGGVPALVGRRRCRRAARRLLTARRPKPATSRPGRRRSAGPGRRQRGAPCRWSRRRCWRRSPPRQGRTANGTTASTWRVFYTGGRR